MLVYVANATARDLAISAFGILSPAEAPSFAFALTFISAGKESFKLFHVVSSIPDRTFPAGPKSAFSFAYSCATCDFSKFSSDVSHWAICASPPGAFGTSVLEEDRF